MKEKVNFASCNRWSFSESPETFSKGHQKSTIHRKLGTFYRKPSDLLQVEEDQFALNSVQLLETVLFPSPEIPMENSHTNQRVKIRYGIIPVFEKHSDFAIPKINGLLRYIGLYHCQYSLIHHSLFSMLATYPLLFLSIIMTGAPFAKEKVSAYLTLVALLNLHSLLLDFWAGQYLPVGTQNFHVKCELYRPYLY